MIVKRLVKGEDGNIEASLMLTSEQAAFLINVGLATLVMQGAAQVKDMTEAEFKAELEAQKEEEQPQQQPDHAPVPAEDKKKQIEYLEMADINTLPKA